ncbi:Holliday junction resolvase RecU [Eubacteriaceae bacterium ES3]|nr:Holliday junction resolvase RecU [Eubacteriaceae bacterium ES3]
MAYWNSRGLRGSQLEENINISNKIYLEQGLAVVQKIPTSIKPVELDPGKGTIKLAYFEEKSTVDYLGNVQGIPICFDAKETGQKSLPIANIHEHQIEFMEAFQKQDGLSFLIVHFKFCDEVFLLPFNQLRRYWRDAKGGGRKSIPYKDFNQDYRIYPCHNILVHYLDAINNYLTRKD